MQLGASNLTHASTPSSTKPASDHLTHVLNGKLFYKYTSVCFFFTEHKPTSQCTNYHFSLMQLLPNMHPPADGPPLPLNLRRPNFHVAKSCHGSANRCSHGPAVTQVQSNPLCLSSSSQYSKCIGCRIILVRYNFNYFCGSVPMHGHYASKLIKFRTYMLIIILLNLLGVVNLILRCIRKKF